MWGPALDKATHVFCLPAACIAPSWYQSSQQGKFPGQRGTDFFRSCNQSVSSGVGSAHGVNSRQPKNKQTKKDNGLDIQILNGQALAATGTKNQVDLRYIYRTFYPSTKEQMFFSTAHGPSKNWSNMRVWNQVSSDKGNWEKNPAYSAYSIIKQLSNSNYNCVYVYGD